MDVFLLLACILVSPSAYPVVVDAKDGKIAALYWLARGLWEARDTSLPPVRQDVDKKK
jgi:hypothetical protein